MTWGSASLSEAIPLESMKREKAQLFRSWSPGCKLGGFLQLADGKTLAVQERTIESLVVKAKVMETFVSKGDFSSLFKLTIAQK